MFHRELRDMAFVPRWTIVRTVKGQNLAEHSYFVTVYVTVLIRKLGWTGDVTHLMTAALFHDIEETFTGDVPGPVKRQMANGGRYCKWVDEMLLQRFGETVFKTMQPPGEDGKLILRLANLVDELMFVATEQALGNSSMPASVLSNIRKRINDTLIDMMHCEDLKKNSSHGGLLFDHLSDLQQRIEDDFVAHRNPHTIVAPVG